MVHYSAAIDKGFILSSDTFYTLEGSAAGQA